jgi:hypothetical protein
MLSPDYYGFKKRTFVLIVLALNMPFFSGAVQDGLALHAERLCKRYKPRQIQQQALPANHPFKQKKSGHGCPCPLFLIFNQVPEYSGSLIRNCG